MPGFTGKNPNQVFKLFLNHISKVVNSTVTDAPISLVVSGASAQISFGKSEAPQAVPLRTKPWFLYLGQRLAAVQEDDGTWQVKTLQYSYRIQAGPSFDDPWYFRFEYVSREVRKTDHPRHHLHIPFVLRCEEKYVDLARTHLPTGWITTEELIRFLIDGLRVKPKRKDWDRFLQQCEEKSRFFEALTFRIGR